MAQHYLEAPVPHVLVCGAPVDQDLLDALASQAKVVFNPREQRRIWLDMAQQNADIQLARLLAEQGSQQARSRALAEALDLPTEN